VHQLGKAQDMKTSDRIKGLVQSDIRRMTRECLRVGGINLGQGICDMPTPPEVLQGTVEAIQADLSVYSRYDGINDLREQIALKMARDNKRPTDAESEIVVTIGTTGAFAATCQALLNPGDEVILFEPYYGYHVNTLLVSGCVPVFITLDAPEWRVTREALEAARTSKTRGDLDQHAGEPLGQGLQAGGAGDHRGVLSGARSAGDHR
jgi:aminotransferase